ncbi:chromosome segregation protein SMC [Sanguibacter suaedae]|uniref:Chromosome partition protein Smc n=1 Tax=Sanguibacter suaedae TaxID=2795737 RepID=A0A934MF36_9MICO|nr:chromosome segregation protein SMC [Sanguibacter suaedae]MBI9116249.1 chromosome segregation protein SMC [Sanguibacter suaedae]
MHLKTLTLRGFKSFASATTLRFEPGVTCVVGPNGSGKSNVVDALAWVMGEQGAKTLRGGKMEDVIFAGTSGRPPLGRAEVSLTIDNTDGALPIEYAEVTITRTLFRNGGSEYAINGSSCRLLDIQDLLSDSGLGREMHVIVGQGQLDAVLRATPEDRRGFVEEAAGVLKHRKRKEKALRKLDSMQGNLARLGDLTAEVRRQLGPLGRQAEVARRAATVQSDLRDARARLLADDLAQALATLEQEAADEAALVERRTRAESDLGSARDRLVALEARAAVVGPALVAANDSWYRLTSVRERVAGLRALAAERVRLLGTPAPPPGDQDPRDLEAQARRVRAAEAELSEEVGRHRGALEQAVAARTGAEADATTADRALTALVRAAADRREGVARLAGQVAARRSRIEAGEAELGRLRASLAEAESRREAAAAELATLEEQVGAAQEGEEDLDADHEDAAALLTGLDARVTALDTARQRAEQDLAAWTARAEALDLSLERKDAAGVLLADEASTGVVGSMATMLTVDAGFEDAVAAALGLHAEAVAVGSVADAVDALRMLRTEDAGRATLVVAGEPAGTPDDGRRAVLPGGAVEVLSVVRCAPAVRGTLEILLEGVVVVDDLAEARAVLARRPDLVVVTRDGDLLAEHRASGGSRSAPSVLHLQAARDEAQVEIDAARARLVEDAQERGALLEARRAAQERYDVTLGRLDESDAQIAAVGERLGHLGATVRGAVAEAERIARQITLVQTTAAEDREGLAELEERLDAAQEEPADARTALETATEDRDRRAQEAVDSRARETEARLTLRTAEERERALAGRAQGLERAAVAARAAREAAAAREAERARGAATAAGVHAATEHVLAAIDASLVLAATERDRADADRRAVDADLVAARSEADALTASLREITDAAHRDEVARTQRQLRVEQLQARSVDDLGIDPVVLVDEFGPHRPVPSAGDGGDSRTGEDTDGGDGPPGASVAPVGRPFVRSEQEKRLRAAERAMAQLGRVNPLALEEFAALEERHKFLSDQLTDLKTSRTDLLEIVREIDDRVEQVFTEAYRDTAAQFERVFATLFPGGEGRLVLTDPTDMLTTGIEVEARPAGKKVKRLSLLSGGERSLTAVALLVAIFKARPSPFYVMDEVEAALDDTNLGRLLSIFTELQQDSQLIVVTHQKRTMEIADALYGVTMRGDGVTTVISQRVRPASDAADAVATADL